MSITISVSSGQIDKGDTKKLSVTPTDANGDAIVPTALAAVFTPPSGAENATSKAIDDFTASDGVYSLNFTFDEAGQWLLVITATDGSGNAEVERSPVFVVE